MFMKLKTQMDQQHRQTPKRKPNNRMGGKPNSQLKPKQRKQQQQQHLQKRKLYQP
jgi:hypothetical protein